MIKKILKQTILILLIISMIFTSSGVMTFANTEVNESSKEETTSIEESFETDENNVEDIEEETIVDLSEKEEPEAESEDKTKDEIKEETKVETEESETESLANTYNTEDETEQETNENDKEAETTSEQQEEIETEQEKSFEELNLETKEDAVNDEILKTPGGGGGGRVKFNESREQIQDRDYTIDGRTEITKVTTTKVVTAPTVTVASSESSKLTFRYWYNDEKNIKFNSGESKALGDNAPSGILTDADPYRTFTPVFNDTRPVMTIQIKDEYLGNVFFGYDRRNYGFYDGEDNTAIYRKLALTSADLEGMKSGLSVSAGYAFSRIVNSSGKEVDPTQWNRSSNVTYYIELKDNRNKVYYKDSKFGSFFSKTEDDVYEGLEYTLPTLVNKSFEATNAGQEFLGWENTTTHEFVEPGATKTFSGSANIEYEAVYSDKTYLYYSLKGYGDSIDRVELGEGEKLVKPTDPTSPNHDFKGWYRDYDLTQLVDFDNDVMGKTNITIYAKWEEKEFSITLNTNGGVYADNYTAPTKRKYSESSTLPTSANITKTGCTFAGWYENADFSGNSVTSIPANTSSNKTYYLKWNEKEYNITYNLNEGAFANGYTAPTKRKLSESTTLPSVNQVVKKGYTFAGWYENAELSGSAVSSIAANTASDKTYYAKWEETEYNIIYHEDGGRYAQGYTRINKRKYSESVTLPNASQITKAGATFLGWYANANFTGDVITVIPANTEEDVHVYMKWDEAEFDIIYHENGGVYKEGYTKTTRRRYSDSVVLPQSVNISKKGFAFGGWYEQADFSGSRITSIPANTGRNVEVYANWVVGNYTITYHENGGAYVNGYTKVTTRGYTDEVKLPTNNDIVKEGFELEGWYETSNFKGSMITKISANTEGNKTLYAKWIGKEFKVNLITNGGTIKSGNVLKYRHTIGAILPTNVTAPPKTETETKDKRFAGWYENENLTGTMVSRIAPESLGEKTYYAKYSYVYNVKFNSGGGSGVMDTLIIDEGKTFTVPTNTFDRSGYKFKGWTSSDGKVYEVNKSYTSDVDITLTATWEEIKKEDEESGGIGDGGNTGGGSSSGGSSTGGDSTGGGSSSGGSSSGGSSTGGKTSGGTSSGGSSSGGSSSGGSSRGGSTSGGGALSGPGASADATSGPGVSSQTTSSGDTIPVVPIIPNVGVPSVENADVSTDAVRKEIENGNAKPGMYYAWEMDNNRWRAKDMVTNDYAKNTFVYVNYASKLRKYFFDENGNMVVGWINHNGYIYYMNPQEGINYGDMMTGVNIVDGNLCEFLPSGEFYRTIM